MKQSYKDALSALLRKNRDTVEALERALELKIWNELEKMGAGLLLSDVYQGVEQILVFFVEKEFGEKIVKNESWHDNLLRRSKELGLYPEDIHRSLRGMLRYRHAQRHGYGIELDSERIRENAPDAIKTYRMFEAHINGIGR